MIYFTVITIFTVLFIFSYPYVVEKMNQVAQKDINIKISEIAPNSTSDVEKSISILNWVNQNLFNPYNELPLISIVPNFGVYSNEPFICIRSISHQTPSLPFVSRCGACGEHALLFRELANASGLRVRSVHNPGGDHNWAEVFIDGEWVVVETSSPYGYDYYGPYDFPTRKTYIFAEYPNLSKEDLTLRYGGNISNVTVTVKEGEKTVENATIVVLSRNLNGGRYEGKILDTGLRCFTNKYGFCNFIINEGTYTILAVKNDEYYSSKVDMSINLKSSNYTIQFNRSLDEVFIYFFEAWPRLNEENQDFHLIDILVVMTSLVTSWFSIIFLFNPYFKLLENE